MICLCGLAFFIFKQASANNFKVSLTHTMSYYDTEHYAQDFLDNIYQPLGFDVSIAYYSTSEGLMRLEKGLLDADFSRFASVVEGYHNLLKVPTPINHINYYYFCLTRDACQDNNLTLVPTSVLKARVYCRDNHLNCKFIRTDRTSIFNMLTKKRGATVISSMYSSVCHTNIKKIYRKKIPALSIEQFHYIHKKHQSILENINQQLQKTETINALAQIREALLAKVWHCNIKVVDID